MEHPKLSWPQSVKSFCYGVVEVLQTLWHDPMPDASLLHKLDPKQRKLN